MLSDQKLLRRLTKLCRAARQIDVGVILLLIEVEDRRLHLEAACSSLHDFCRRKLGWSEGTTHRRIEAARVVRRCPAIALHVKSGAITLSALAQVRTYIDASNVEEWVRLVSGKSRRRIELLIADVTPKPDVVSRMRQLPPVREPTPDADADLAAAVGAAAASGARTSGAEGAPAGEVLTAGSATVDTGSPVGAAPAGGAVAAALAAGAPMVPPRPARTVRVEPLGDARWKIQLMARQGLHDKVERAQALMRHRNPSGDLAVVFEAALDALLERLERPRRSPPSRSGRQAPAGPPGAPTRTSHATVSDAASARGGASTSGVGPRATAARVRTKQSAGEVSLATRRAVFARDGERCTFVSDDGQRCPATELLEVDHILARGLGGSGELPNLRLCCRAHNQLHAEKSFGRAHVEQRIQERKHPRRTSTVEVGSRSHEAHDRSSARPHDAGDRSHQANDTSDSRDP